MKKYYFGYDIDNVMKVEDYVKKNFPANLYTLQKGYGDDVMNCLEIHSHLKNNIGLNELISNCDGEGDYSEQENIVEVPLNTTYNIKYNKKTVKEIILL